MLQLCSDESFSTENTCPEVAGESCSTKILEVAAANVPVIHKNNSYHSKNMLKARKYILLCQHLWLRPVQY